jgi:hypothetical protein
MRRKWVIYGLLAAALMLLAAGCGGAQNPVRFANHSHPFFSGLWDGLTILVGLVFEVLGSDRYGIYAVSSNSNWYDFGYLIGVWIFLGLFAGAGFFRVRRRFYR